MKINAPIKTLITECLESGVDEILDYTGKKSQNTKMTAVSNILFSLELLLEVQAIVDKNSDIGVCNINICGAIEVDFNNDERFIISQENGQFAKQYWFGKGKGSPVLYSSKQALLDTVRDELGED